MSNTERQQRYELIREMYRTMTSSEIADKLGMTAANVRRILSDHGEKDPKRIPTDRFRNMVRTLRERYGWSAEEIAHQMMCETRRVKRALRSIYGVCVQLTIWAKELIMGEPKPRNRRPKGPCVGCGCQQIALEL